MNLQAETTRTETREITYLKRVEMPAVLQKLSKHQSVQIRIKRIDRMHYSNFAIVVRATAAFVLLRDLETGETEILPDISNVSEFELSSNLAPYTNNTVYTVIP